MKEVLVALPQKRVQWLVLKKQIDKSSIHHRKDSSDLLETEKDSISCPTKIAVLVDCTVLSGLFY